MKRTNIRLIVLLGVIFVSFSSIITKTSEAPSLAIATYRLGFTTLLLLPSVLLKKKEEIKSIDKGTLKICILSGIFLAFHFATWITSIKYTSIASSTVLVNTHPVFIVLATLFIFKEKVPKKILLSISITLVGSIIISAGDSTLGNNILLGDILAVLGAFFVAGYVMIGSIARQKLSVTSYTFIVYLTSTIALFLLALITKTPLYPYPPKEWIIFLSLAVFCTILGHSIFNWALEYIKPTFISTAVLGEPVFATIWAIFIFKEIPTIWQIVGSLVIIYGIYIFAKIKEESSQHTEDEQIILE